MRNPTTPLSVIRINPTDPDPAIDSTHDQLNLRGYITTREEEHLRFKPDGNPVRFLIERLPQAFLTDVLDSTYPLAARRLLAFRAACHRVESNGGPVALENGARLESHPAKLAPKNAPFVCTDGEHGTDISPLAFAQEVADLYSMETVQEMGQVAIDFARLPRGKRGPFTSWVGSVASG